MSDLLRMPEDREAECLVLGAALTDQEGLSAIRSVLHTTDFGLERHRVIFNCTVELADQGVRISCPDLAHELHKRGQLELAGGVTYLAELSDIPHLCNLDRYCERVRKTAIRRQTIVAAQSLIDRCSSINYEDGEALIELERIHEIVSSCTRRVAGRTVEQIIEDAGV
jgi:replicative DNA helicase